MKLKVTQWCLRTDANGDKEWEVVSREVGVAEYSSQDLLRAAFEQGLVKRASFQMTDGTFIQYEAIPDE